MRAQSTVKFLSTGADSDYNTIGLGARAQSTSPYAASAKIYGYTCFYLRRTNLSRLLIGVGTSIPAMGNVDDITDGSWYTLEFTAKGTDLTCTLYDEDGTTVGSETYSDDTYTSGYNGLVPYTLSVDTTAWYVSEYAITIL